MKPGFCYVAERIEPGQAVRNIVDSFSRVGIVLANPSTKRITALAEDGEQVDTTEARLVEAAAVQPELAFQIWMSSSVDVGPGLKRIAPGTMRHSYSVDGLDVHERARLMEWTVKYFRAAAAAGTAVLLVVDQPGMTVDVDWDDVVRGTTPLPSVLPPILGLPASWVCRLGDLAGYTRERIADLELLKLPPPVVDAINLDW